MEGLFSWNYSLVGRATRVIKYSWHSPSTQGASPEAAGPTVCFGDCVVVVVQTVAVDVVRSYYVDWPLRPDEVEANPC